jgi:hypothetical protein
MALTLICMHNIIHDNYKYTYMHKHKLQHHMVLIFEMVVIPPTTCRPSTNLPALYHATHQAQQWVTPKLGLSSTPRKEILG